MRLPSRFLMPAPRRWNPMSRVQADKWARMLRGERVVASDEDMSAFEALEESVALGLASVFNAKQVGTRDRYVAFLKRLPRANPRRRNSVDDDLLALERAVREGVPGAVERLQALLRRLGRSPAPAREEPWTRIASVTVDGIAFEVQRHPMGGAVVVGPAWHRGGRPDARVRAYLGTIAEGQNRIVLWTPGVGVRLPRVYKEAIERDLQRQGFRANPLTRREAAEVMEDARRMGRIRDDWHVGNAVGRYATVAAYAGDRRYRVAAARSVRSVQANPRKLAGYASVRRVPLRGDYDASGRYWGAGPPWLFVGETVDGDVRHVRAMTRDEAMARLAETGARRATNPLTLGEVGEMIGRAHDHRYLAHQARRGSCERAAQAAVSREYLRVASDFSTPGMAWTGALHRGRFEVERGLERFNPLRVGPKFCGACRGDVHRFLGRMCSSCEAKVARSRQETRRIARPARSANPLPLALLPAAASGVVGGATWEGTKAVARAARRRNSAEVGLAVAEGLSLGAGYGLGIGVALPVVGRLMARGRRANPLPASCLMPSPRRRNSPGAFIFAIGNDPKLPRIRGTRESFHGWVGGDSRTLYAFTDRRTGQVTVRPGAGTGRWKIDGVGPEVDVRVATRAEAERGWQSPLHPGWRVAEANRGTRRRNGSSTYRIKLPADRVLGTMSLAEARRRWGQKVGVQVAAFEDFQRGARPFDDVILYDDGRREVSFGYVAGKSPEQTYGGFGGSPPGSFKNSGGVVGGDESEQTTWVHESPNQYLVGRAQLDRRGRPVTRDFELIGDMVASNGWLRR